MKDYKTRLEVILTQQSKKSTEYIESLVQYIPGGVHSHFRYIPRMHPIVVKKTQNSRVWDFDAKEYLDLSLRSGAILLGHNHEEFNERLLKALDKVIGSDNTPETLEAVEIVKQHMPHIEMLRFSLSGSEAIQNSIRLARAYTGKNYVLKFEGQYHGHWDPLLGGKVYDYAIPIVVDDGNGIWATKGRTEMATELHTIMLPLNDPGLLEKTFEKYSEDIAAVIIEPESIMGGFAVETYLFEKLNALCKKHHCVFILNEIDTGLRLSPSGFKETEKIQPDIRILGKSIANGLPVSVFGGKKKLMSIYADNKVIHGGTFNGYSLGIEAMIAVFDIIGCEGGYEQMRTYSGAICDVFQEAIEDTGIKLCVQGNEISNICYLAGKKNVDEWQSYDIMNYLQNLTVRECMAKHGIITSPMFRIYGNFSLNSDDVDFFSLRIKPALKEAKILLERLYDKH